MFVVLKIALKWNKSGIKFLSISKEEFAIEIKNPCKICTKSLVAIKQTLSI